MCVVISRTRHWSRVQRNPPCNFASLHNCSRSTRNEPRHKQQDNRCCDAVNQMWSYLWASSRRFCQVEVMACVACWHSSQQDCSCLARTLVSCALRPPATSNILMLMHNLQYHYARLCMGCNDIEQDCAHCMAMDRKGAAVREHEMAWSNTQHRNSMSFVHHTSCIRVGHVQKGPSCCLHIRKLSGQLLVLVLDVKALSQTG
jgi:hypothetical protein